MFSFELLKLNKMKNLSSEILDEINNKSIDLAIEYANGADYNSNTKHFIKKGMLQVLSDYSFLSKCGLISLEDALGFAEWVADKYQWIPLKKKFVHDDDYDANELQPSAQLFQIYQEQKER